MIRPTGYPPIEINFKRFCIQLKSMFTDSSVFNTNELNEYYQDYKEHQYLIKLDWVKEHGYETVSEWCKEHFKEWNLKEHRTMLKCFKDKLGKWMKCDEIMPEPHVAVLVFVPEQDDLICVACWQHRDEWMEIYEGGLISESVTHWMKLPKNPKI